ncbi:MAG: SDR family oxidoreductase [Clostridiales bacterium]|nr:SDR family oxidoreductase [Clostridiales bacterium]
METLKGRTCVFAGATGRIGQGAVKALAQAGMNVVMVTHNPESAGDIVAALSGCPGRVAAVSNENGDGAVFGQIEREFGSVDVVINTIGSLDKVCSIEQITEDKLRDKLEHQVTLPFLMMQAAIPYLERSSAPRMIFASTAGALDGFGGENLADSIARGAIITATYALARELAAKGITVNCIARSGMINDHDPRTDSDFDVKSIAHRIPMGHIGTAEEFGALVAYIASEESGFITGQVFNLTGGIHIG